MKQVAVFGAGIAGSTFIREMATAPVEITLVDPKDYVEVPFASLRALMDPEGFGKTVRPHHAAVQPSTTSRPSSRS